MQRLLGASAQFQGFRRDHILVEVTCAVEKVELVSEVAVPTAGQEMDEQLRSRQHREEPQVKRPGVATVLPY